MISQNQTSTTEQVRMLRLPEVIRKTALSRSQIYRLIAIGDFPKQVSLSERVASWVEEEIDLWLKGRIEHSRNHQVKSKC